MLALLLSIALTPEAPVFPDPVIVQIRVTNTSTADVTIPLISQNCGYVFNVVDEATQEALPPRRCKTISSLVPVTIQARSDFEVAIPLSDFVTITKPGTYTVQAQLLAPPDGQVTSNIVTLVYGTPSKT
jgi:hypothetical protein